jgi:hypothetical protein
MSLDLKRLQVQLANVRAARLANELKVDELREAIERIEKDIQVSLAKETDLETQIKNKENVNE